MRNWLTLLTKGFLDVMFYLGGAAWLSLPITVKQAGRYYQMVIDYYPMTLASLLISGVFCLLIVYELRKMFRTVLAGQPFIRANQWSLKRMGCYSFLIALALAPFVFFILRPAAFIIAFIFIIAGLFSLVLSQVFEQAVNYKEENDLTI